MAGLKNGDIITGPAGEQTQLFFQAATPTPDVANAIWYKPIDNGVPETSETWMYNGSLWLSENYFIGGGNAVHSANSSSSSSPHSAYWNSSNSRFTIFIKTIDLYGNCTSADGSNFWTIDIRFTAQTDSSITSAISPSPSFTPYVVNVPGVFYTRVSPSYLLSSINRPLSLSHFATKTGTPANLNCSSRIVLRKVHP